METLVFSMTVIGIVGLAAMIVAVLASRRNDRAAPQFVALPDRLYTVHFDRSLTSEELRMIADKWERHFDAFERDVDHLVEEWMNAKDT